MCAAVDDKYSSRKYIRIIYVLFEICVNNHRNADLCMCKTHQLTTRTTPQREHCWLEYYNEIDRNIIWWKRPKCDMTMWAQTFRWA